MCSNPYFLLKTTLLHYLQFVLLLSQQTIAVDEEMCTCYCLCNADIQNAHYLENGWR